MDPGELYSSYDRYKKGTKTITTYLASKGRQCGYQLEEFSERLPTSAVATGKKKLGGGNKAPVKAPSSVDSKKKYIIPVRLFCPLAETIANHDNPPVEIPGSLFHTLRQTIIARTERNIHFRQRDGDHTEENQSHAYFIEVLEKVEEILRPSAVVEKLKAVPLQPQSSSDAPADTSASSKEDHLHTRFASLNVEYTSEEYLNAADFVPPVQDVDSAEYEIEDMEDDGDFDFKVNCLFVDVNKIHSLLLAEWRKYKNGDCDLLRVSIMTTAAIDVVRRLEEHFGSVSSKMPGYEVLAKQCYEAALLREDPEGPLDSPIHARCYDLAKWLFHSTTTMLRTYADRVKQGGFLCPPNFDSFYQNVHRYDNSDEDAYLLDQNLLLEVLPVFLSIARQPGSLLCIDELSRGLQDVFQGGQIPLWVAFAAQNLIDTHHLLGDKLFNGFETLQDHGRQMKETLAKHLPFHKDLEIPWMKAENEYLNSNVVRTIEGYYFQDCLEAVYRSATRSNPQFPALPPFHLFKRHPVLCGLTDYTVQLRLQAAGTNFASLSCCALTIAHIYNAVVKEGFCAHDWADMATFVKLHTPENLFRGSLPEGEYLSRYYVVVGGSLVALAEKKRKVKGGKTQGAGQSSIKGGAMELSETAVVLNAFGGRYRRGEGQTSVEVTWARVEKLLNERWEPNLDRQGPVGDDATGLVRPKTPNPQKKSVSTRTLDTFELLIALRQTLDEELPELYFDHLRFHRTCWKLLRQLKAELMPLLHDYFEQGILEDERALWQLPGYILMTANGSGKLRKKIAMRDMKKGVPLSMDVLKAAGRVVEEFLGTREK